MDDLQLWIRRNMVIEHFGDFAGLRDLTIGELNELELLVKKAKQPRLIEKPAPKVKVPLRPA